MATETQLRAASGVVGVPLIPGVTPSGTVTAVLLKAAGWGYPLDGELSGGLVCGTFSVSPRMDGTFTASARTDGTFTVVPRVDGTFTLREC